MAMIPGTYESTCHLCDEQFEWSTDDCEGNCPHCGAHYWLEWDCGDEHDSVIIPVFDDLR